MIKKFFDIKFLKFIAVGIINTAFSAIIMFFLYNTAKFGYWGSSVTAYILASIMSFFLNKSFTFNNKNSVMETAYKFALNVAVCYFVAYSVSKPLMIFLLTNAELSAHIIDQIAMLFGMVIFTMLNYIGQRFFAFKES
ncbi:MAG: GtrA family protein [Firmicutes bacterium]|nr:GtrA family protein [Bacillota bacterium]